MVMAEPQWHQFMFHTICVSTCMYALYIKHRYRQFRPVLYGQYMWQSSFMDVHILGGHVC